MANRGNINTIDQTQTGLLSGGASARQIVTTAAVTKTPGNLLAWDAAGNASDSGITGISSASGTPILDASGNPIFDADGNWIFPG